MPEMGLNSLRLTLLLVILGCTGLPLATLSLSFLPGTTYRFVYKTETSVNKASGSSESSGTTERGWKDVGIRFNAKVEVTSVWSDEDDGGNAQLIKVVARDAELRGLAAEGALGSSGADRLFRLPSFFLLERGLVTRAFSSKERRLSSNVYAGIASLLQLGEESGEEEDVSGTCRVTYERRGDYKLIKTKRNCHAHDSPEFSNVNEALGVRRDSRISAEYSFSDHSVLSIKSQETHELGSEIGNPVAVVKSSQQLSLVEEEPSREGRMVGSVGQVVQQILRDYNKLTETSLKTVPNKGVKCSANCKKLESTVEELRAKVESPSIGQPGSSSAFLALVAAFRVAEAKEILQVLRKYKKDEAVFPALMDAACSAQTPEAHASLVKLLDFRRDDPRVLERFLLSSALSTHPSAELLAYLTDLSSLRLNNNKELRESIDGALGSVLFAYSKSAKRDAVVADRAADVLLGHLAACKADDVECQLPAVRALSNAGMFRAAGPLVELLERSRSSVVGEACLKALRRLDIGLVDSEFGQRLRDIFHQRRRGYDPVVRTRALKLLLPLLGKNESGREEEVEEIFAESMDPWNEEFNLYVQSVIFDRAEKDPGLRALLKKRILNNPVTNNYHVLAPNGKSLAFSSEMNGSPKVDYHMYVENGRSGSMRRSGMDVDLVHLGSPLPLYKFELFAAGLGSLMGNGKKEEEEEVEEVTAGMSLDMMGVSLRPITFFVGQGGLMTAIWNAPTEPVSALQVNFLLQDHLEHLPLGNGLHVKLEVSGAVSLDLSGSLSVSLWNKNARSLIRNRGSASLSTGVELSSDLFSVGNLVSDSVDSGLDFRTDVDFYDEAKMCLRMERADPSRIRRLTTRLEKIAGSPRSFSSRATSGFDLPGVSYPLPRSNGLQCRALFPNGP